MCKQFHAAHHAIIHAHDDYDGYYFGFFETLNAIIFAYLPTFIIPKVHVIAVIIYQVLSAFFIFSMNHCGRDVKIAFDWSFGYTKPLILYDTQNHNDHHLFRRGNYSELLPILDKMFGTAIEVEIRQPLPAQKRWKKLAQNMKVVATCMKKSDSSNKWIALNEDVPSRQASEISLDKFSKLD